MEMFSEWVLSARIPLVTGLSSETGMTVGQNSRSSSPTGQREIFTNLLQFLKSFFLFSF